MVGVGQYLHREGDPLEPTDLMVEAVRRAEADAGLAGVAASADVVAAVPTFSWRYRDPGRLVADRVGATTARTWYVTVGGNSPQRLLNKLAVEIHEGRADLAVLCGGEAVRSKQAAKRRA